MNNKNQQNGKFIFYNNLTIIFRKITIISALIILGKYLSDVLFMNIFKSLKHDELSPFKIYFSGFWGHIDELKFLLLLFLFIIILTVLLHEKAQSFISDTPDWKSKFFKYLTFSADLDYRSTIFYSVIGLIVLLISKSSLAVAFFLTILFLFAFKNTEGTDTPEESPSSLADNPITDISSDELHRDNFFATFAEIIKQSPIKGSIITLDGDWGSGKTSAVNCVKELLNKEEIRFAEINPWNNDSKERFSKALLGEINSFCKDTYPHFSLPNDLSNNMLKAISLISINGISFNTPELSDNISSNIEELSQKLKHKRQRLLIFVDDLDRLDKKFILDILAVLYLFHDCYNISFILAANISKVEQLLTEIQEKYLSIKPLKTAPYYGGYLEKMSSNIIKMPAPEEEDLKESLKKRIDQILKKQQMPLFSQEETASIPLGVFKNIRNIKRVLQNFGNSIMQQKVREEVYPFHFLLVTILYLHYNEIYNRIREKKGYWVEGDFDKKLYHVGDNEFYKECQEYFNSLLDLYPQDKNALKQIFFALSPNFRFYILRKSTIEKTGESALLNMNCPLPEYVDKGFYIDKYFNRYFTHNFSESQIPDKIMDKYKSEFVSAPEQNIKINLTEEFIRRHQNKLPSFFDYINTHIQQGTWQDEKPLLLGCVQAINDQAVDLEKKEKIFDEMFRMIDKNNGKEVFIKEIFDKLKEPPFKYLVYSFYTSKSKNDPSINANILKYLGDGMRRLNLTLGDILSLEEKYNSFLGVKTIIFSWIRDFKNEKDPTLDKKIFEERRNQAISVFKNNEPFFWSIIGNSLIIQLEPPHLWINDLKKLWGLDNIIDIIDTLLKKKNLSNKKGLLQIKDVINKYRTEENKTPAQEQDSK